MHRVATHCKIDCRCGLHAAAVAASTMRATTIVAARAAALASGLVLALPVSDFDLTSAARAPPAPALTKAQADALAAYNQAVGDFKAILRQRRAQIDAKQQLPNLPGQALYLARNNMISTY